MKVKLKFYRCCQLENMLYPLRRRTFIWERNHKHGNIQCKIIHRTYFTKVWSAKIYPNVSPACDRCHQSPANLVHSLWSCPSLSHFWTALFDTLSDLIGQPIATSSSHALFGVSYSLHSPLTGKKHYVFYNPSGSKTDTKEPTLPPFPLWIRDIFFFLNLDKSCLSLAVDSNNFSAIWGPFFLYLKRKKIHWCGCRSYFGVSILLFFFTNSSLLLSISSLCMYTSINMYI